MGLSGKKLLVVQVAGLSAEVARGLELPGLSFEPIDSVFPAVTCTVQGSFRTAASPGEHGMIANGLYHRGLRRAMFWEQSSALVDGPRIWDSFRADGGRVGMLFWQQSLGEDVDVVLSPAPIHKHHGGMIQDCYTQPPDLYARLRAKLGDFQLKHYWGPMASAKVGDWIARATATVLADADLKLDVLLSYLPTLDYDFQRYGPSHAKSAAAIGKLREQLMLVLDAAKQQDAEVMVFGDYAIADATGSVVYPNRALAEAGLLAVRDVRGMQYPDFHHSRAFAVVDHEIAHVYVPGGAADVAAAGEILAELPGVETVMDAGAREAAGLNHAAAGELIVVAADSAWCAYPWWSQPSQAPDYARHVDIHNKPGFDPCELVMSWWPPGVSTDASRIGGTHGRTGPGRQVAWAGNFDPGRSVESILDVAAALRERLNQ